MTDPYLHLYANCSNLMSLFSEKDQYPWSKLFQFGRGGAVVDEQNQFIGC